MSDNSNFYAKYVNLASFPNWYNMYYYYFFKCYMKLKLVSRKCKAFPCHKNTLQYIILYYCIVTQ